jgi:hypothetical protein
VTSDNDQPPAAPAPEGRNTGPNAEQASQPLEMPAESPPVEAAPNTASGDAASSGEPEASDRPPSDESPAAPPSAPPRRVSLLGAATAGGGLVLAVIGLASLFLSRGYGVSDLDARLAAVEQQVRNAPAPAAPDTRALDDVTSRLAKLEAAGASGASAASDPALADRIAALQGEVKALGETVGMLGRRNDEALAAAREARSRAEATAAATAAALATLAQKVASAPTVDRGELESKFDTLGNRITGLERNDKALESELAKRAAAENAGDRAVRLGLAAAALKTAVERGDSYAPEVATVKALGAAPKVIAPLEPFAATGVPSGASLAASLAALAPSLRPAAGAPREGLLQRLQVNAEKLVRVQRTDEVAGNEPAAIIARIEVRAANADIAGALAELLKLPPSARAPAEAWIKQAQARYAAIAASQRLAADALAGLGK